MKRTIDDMDSTRRAATVLFALAAILGSSGRARADQKEYAVSDFSDEFRATVTVEDTGAVFEPGVVSVFERRTGRGVLRVESDELAFDVTNGRIDANVVELPYGRQSVVIYDDFDFDGRRDLAIMDGQKSCYHGPSFQIFLRRGRAFVNSAGFTALAHDYCGMFAVDARNKRLHAMTKSGCCWHEYDTFRVVAGTPYLIQSVVESSEESPAYLKVEERHGRRSSTHHVLMPPGEAPSELLFAFDLAGPRHKRVEVFATDRVLDYALVVGPERRVEFSHRFDVPSAERNRAFIWDPEARTLSFRNGAYRYVIHDGPRLGVAVHRGGHVVFLAGAKNTRKGALADLLFTDFENVEVVR